MRIWKSSWKNTRSNIQKQSSYTGRAKTGNARKANSQKLLKKKKKLSKVLTKNSNKLMKATMQCRRNNSIPNSSWRREISVLNNLKDK